jgi:hypothetical protein
MSIDARVCQHLIDYRAAAYPTRTHAFNAHQEAHEMVNKPEMSDVQPEVLTASPKD